MPLVVADLVAKMGLDQSELDRGLAKVTQHPGLADIGKKMTDTGRKMTMGMTLPLLGVAALAVKSAAAFETNMNQVQAASGASSTELKSLSDYAKKMGAATVFSAGEASAAMLELSKSGFTPAQIKAGALKATMDLAAAGGLELADAATITSNAMNTFGLKAKDATTIAAALAGGANASSADVSDLALALSQVGPGAKTAGLSMQETVAVLSEFADKGIRGSDAGTSLKTMLISLVPSTKKATAMMKDLGIEFNNSDGSFKSISEISQVLQDKMGGLSAEQRTLAMNTIFGSDATRAATILMEGGSEGLAKYTKATNNQSAATDMANARMKGMGGAIENMKGSLETAGITIGEILAPAVTRAAGGIKAMADGLQGMPGWAQKAAVGAGVFLAALGPVLLVAGKIATALVAIQKFRMGKSALGGITDITGGAADATLKAAIALNTTATEANTLALAKGGLPGGGTPGGGAPVGAPGGGSGGFFSNLKGPFSWTGFLGMVGMSAGGAGVEAVAPSAKDLAWMKSKLHDAGTQAGQGFTVGLDEAMSKLGAKAAAATGPAADRIRKEMANIQSLVNKGFKFGDINADKTDGQLRSIRDRIMSTLHVTQKQADAIMASMFKDWRPQPTVMGKISPAMAAAEARINKLRAEASRAIKFGSPNTTALMNAIARASAAFDGMSSAARTAGNAAANALAAASGTGGSSYRGHFMAAGGVVYGRTLATIGEAGPEAVIPLTDPRRAAQVMAEAGLLGGGGGEQRIVYEEHFHIHPPGGTAVIGSAEDVVRMTAPYMARAHAEAAAAQARSR